MRDSQFQNIIICSDHNGVKLKKKIIKSNFFNLNFIDIGPFTSKNKVDYTDFSQQACEIMNNNNIKFGVFICGTGVGMSISANKFKNIRAALVLNKISATNSREHNNSNIICLGSWINSDNFNISLLKIWLNQKFGEGRHTKRVLKIDKPLKKNDKIIFLNGVFDIIHQGHISLLKFAKSLGGKVIVAINSDKSVKKIKGNDRPYQNQELRRNILIQLKTVDEVIVFNENKPNKLIEELEPDIIVRGSEYTVKEIRKRDKIKNSIKIITMKNIKGSSTSAFVKKIKKND